MHDIEPWWGWRDDYCAERDRKSPFYGRQYDEFTFSSKIYNHYIHPQWDDIGSETLYIKLLYADYKAKFAIIELIGEWNDAIGNDIMFLKREIVDELSKNNVCKYILLCDNVLNFHGDDDSYYEEWYDDVKDDGGYVCLVNLFEHVESELQKFRLYNYISFGPPFNELNWRSLKPNFVLDLVENIMFRQQKLI